jgi:hypothetical protein
MSVVPATEEAEAGGSLETSLGSHNRTDVSNNNNIKRSASPKKLARPQPCCLLYPWLNNYNGASEGHVSSTLAEMAPQVPRILLVKASWTGKELFFSIAPLHPELQNSHPLHGW